MMIYYIVFSLFALCLFIYLFIYYCASRLDKKYEAVIEDIERKKRAMEAVEYYRTGRLVKIKDENGNDIVILTYGYKDN